MGGRRFSWSRFVDTFGSWSGVWWLYPIGGAMIFFVNVTVGVAFLIVILGIQVIWAFEEKREAD